MDTFRPAAPTSREITTEMSPETKVQEVLVLEPDRLRGAVLAQTISTTFPSARVYCESEPAVAAVLLAERAIELFVVAVRGFDLDILTLLGVWAEHDVGRTRVLVVTANVNSTALKAVRMLPVTGVFDSSCGDLRELEFACRAIASGATYWSPSVQSDAKSHSPDSGLTDAAPLAIELPSSRSRRQPPPGHTGVQFRRWRR